jgi:putative ABC transport system substrate-binding protein
VTSTLPIVTAGGDVVGPGLVTNIARPGGNITGVSTNATATYGKWVELLHDTVPTLSRLAAVVDFATSGLRWIEPAVHALQFRLASYDLRDLDRLPAVLATAKADGADAVVFVSGGVLGGGGNARIGAEVLKSGLPSIAESPMFPRNGGLMALGTNVPVLTRRSAVYVDKILKGAKPGDLPIDQATSFDLVVNLTSARTLGLSIPLSVLQQATEVIQ